MLRTSLCRVDTPVHRSIAFPFLFVVPPLSGHELPTLRKSVIDIRFFEESPNIMIVWHGMSALAFLVAVITKCAHQRIGQRPVGLACGV